MKCKFCNGAIISKSDDSYCVDCNKMAMTEKFSEKINFGSDKKIEGQFHNISRDGGNRDLNESRLRKANDFIQSIGDQLKLDKYNIESAQRLYKLVQEKNFIKGRHSNHVAAAALYTVCRKEKKPYLLIDFSEILSTNMYILANYFLKIVKILNFELPPTDPSIYIDKFCASLNFENQKMEIRETVKKLLKGMTKDWMSYGRRPASLCGAAIWIAAKMHGVKRTTRQIVNAVHICDETIRKRLEEFKETSLAKLTREELTSMPIEDIEKRITEERDPPSYIKNQSKIEKYQKEINFEEETQRVLQMEKVLSENLEHLKITNQLVDADKALENGNSVVDFGPEDEPVDINTTVNYIPEWHNDQSDNEELTDMEENEAEQYLLPPAEHSIKTIFWHHMHREWIEEQNNKKEITKEKKGTPKKRKKSIISVIDATDPYNALKRSSIGSSLNDPELQSLFSDEPEPEKRIKF